MLFVSLYFQNNILQKDQFFSAPPLIFSNNNSAVYKSERILINGEELLVFVADTPAKRERGLYGSIEFEDNKGMLFIFESPDKYGIWMKDMLFPIDIIWIDGNLKIVDIIENALPESFPKVFAPKENAIFVLEVPAGAVYEKNITIGDKIMRGL